jgi:hypothetical protein
LTNPHIAAFVQVFSSGTPAEVRCPDSPEEWSLDLGGPLNAEEIYGRTFTRTAVVEFRSDLCPILDNLANSSADDSTKESRSSTFRSAFCASARVANPPTCGRADPRPSSRYRYAHNG